MTKNKEDYLKSVVTNPDIRPSLGQKLVDTKVFDSDYYAAQAGKEFTSKKSAAIHFVQFGMKSGLSLHPLMDLAYFPKAVRDRYINSDVEFVLAYLKSAQSRQHTWSALFDPRQLTDKNDESSRLLSRFRYDTEPPLPLPATFLGIAPAWREVRSILIDHAHASRSYAIAKKPLRYKTWAGNVEREWVSRAEEVHVESSERPIVSIIMPVYNREIPIRTAIDSVRSQSLEHWELIVVDDGSTDQTREIVRAYSLIDNRIRLIEAKHRGVCAARNTGIGHADGEYLAFLDSDNTWRPDFLKFMIAGMHLETARAAYCAIRMINDREEYTGQPVDATKLLLRNLVDLNVLVAEARLVRDIGVFDENLRRWVDHDLVLRIIKESPISYFPFIGCDYYDDDSDDRITKLESTSWQYAVLGKNLGDWVKPDISYGHGESSDVTVIFRVSGDIPRALANLRCLVESNDVKPWEIVVVEEIEEYRKSVNFRAAVTGLPGLRYIKLPRQYTRAIASNIGAMHADGHNILFVGEGVEVRPGSVHALLSNLEDQSIAAVQPLVADSTGVVLSAGSVLCKNSPAVPLFRGLAIADAQRHSGVGVDELSASAFLVRSDVFNAIGKLNPIFEGDGAFSDLFSRIGAAHPGSLHVNTNAIVIDHNDNAWAHPHPLALKDLEWLAPYDNGSRSVADHYRDIGLDVQHLAAPQFPGLQPVNPSATRSHGPHGQRLRWAIKIGADFTIGGDRWGDVPYARDLADALRSQNQEVVIDRADAFTRPSNYLDDVVLVIRGLRQCLPQPGKINVLWVISRPDQITRSELLGFDVVYGASRLWCDFVSREWGVKAVYLPQATNPARFYPPNHVSDVQFDLAFVGGPRKPIGRKVVADCLAVGRPVSVWGARWSQFVPQDMVVADFVDNDKLVDIYQSARIVLNDHFEDMAAWGFANNRLYDAVASGARVISDNVDGIADIFMGAVQTYGSHDELVGLLSNPSVFPSDDELLRISSHVRENHNFDRRAEVLVDRVVSLFNRHP